MQYVLKIKPHGIFSFMAKSKTLLEFMIQYLRNNIERIWKVLEEVLF